MNEPATGERSFEQSLAELEAIVRELEDGKTDLDTAIQRYEKGIGLLKSCQAMLARAEQRVMKLAGLDDSGLPVTEPFSTESTDENG